MQAFIHFRIAVINCVSKQTETLKLDTKIINWEIRLKNKTKISVYFYQTRLMIIVVLVSSGSLSLLKVEHKNYIMCIMYQ